MEDESNRPPKVLGHAYWLPGIEGIVLEAALKDLIESPTNGSLTITKSRLKNGTWFYEFTPVKGAP